jgi:hypothetical protein
MTPVRWAMAVTYILAGVVLYVDLFSTHVNRFFLEILK